MRSWGALPTAWLCAHASPPRSTDWRASYDDSPERTAHREGTIHAHGEAPRRFLLRTHGHGTTHRSDRSARKRQRTKRCAPRWPLPRPGQTVSGRLASVPGVWNAGVGRSHHLRRRSVQRGRVAAQMRSGGQAMFLKNYTSEVPVTQTIARIEHALIKAGVSGIAKEYSPTGNGEIFAI